ncbi:uncharacterized protein ACIQIH_008076 isoform 1-T1 [Cyanocitta cristata]
MPSSRQIYLRSFGFGHVRVLELRMPASSSWKTADSAPLSLPHGLACSSLLKISYRTEKAAAMAKFFLLCGLCDLIMSSRCSGGKQSSGMIDTDFLPQRASMREGSEQHKQNGELEAGPFQVAFDQDLNDNRWRQCHILIKQRLPLNYKRPLDHCHKNKVQRQLHKVLAYDRLSQI